MTFLTSLEVTRILCSLKLITQLTVNSYQCSQQRQIFCNTFSNGPEMLFSASDMAKLLAEIFSKSSSQLTLLTHEYIPFLENGITSKRYMSHQLLKKRFKQITLTYQMQKTTPQVNQIKVPEELPLLRTLPAVHYALFLLYKEQSLQQQPDQIIAKK